MSASKTTGSPTLTQRLPFLLNDKPALVAARQWLLALEPDVAIAVDVTHATDVPSVDVKREGEKPFGSGPELAIGSYAHREVTSRLIETAEAEGIPYSIGVAPAHTYTDADDIAKNRGGVPTAIVSIPNRYMHSPNEMIDPEDIENVIRLIAAFIGGLDGEVTFQQ